LCHHTEGGEGPSDGGDWQYKSKVKKETKGGKKPFQKQDTGVSADAEIRPGGGRGRGRGYNGGRYSGMGRACQILLLLATSSRAFGTLVVYGKRSSLT
jgi:hypothetical protein